MEFENPDKAEKALKHMDGGQIDGYEITATIVLVPWPRPPRSSSAFPGNTATASHVVPVTTTDEKVMFPEQQVPHVPVILLCHRHRNYSSSS